MTHSAPFSKLLGGESNDECRVCVGRVRWRDGIALPIRVLAEDSIDDKGVEVQVRVQRRAEALYNGDGAKAAVSGGNDSAFEERPWYPSRKKKAASIDAAF